MYNNQFYQIKFILLDGAISLYRIYLNEQNKNSKIYDVVH